MPWKEMLPMDQKLDFIADYRRDYATFSELCAWVGVTHTLAGEFVGLEEVGDGLWDVYFGPVLLGRMDERMLRIEDHRGRWIRRNVSPMSPD
jgi:hypothetical protein